MYLMCKEQLDFSKTSFSQPGGKKNHQKQLETPPSPKQTQTCPEELGCTTPEGAYEPPESLGSILAPEMPISP